MLPNQQYSLCLEKKQALDSDFFEEQGRSARASIPSMRTATLRLLQEFANTGDHLCAVKLDIGHEGLMRETSHPVFQVEAGRAESGEICSNFLGDGLWRPHVERSLRPNLISSLLLVWQEGLR